MTKGLERKCINFQLISDIFAAFEIEELDNADWILSKVIHCQRESFEYCTFDMQMFQATKIRFKRLL